MDKPSQAKPYAGLVIYRIQRNVEFLLLNDSFANKKNWFCPKGQVIGNEDEIKCALRETLEATGLHPKELHVEDGFAIELKYLSGTKPKKVKYHLAQLIDSHIRLLPNAEGVHMQWFNQSTCCEKVVFKTMQEVFKHAQSFIDLKRRKFAGRSNNGANTQQDKSEVRSLSITGDEGNKPVYRPRHQQTAHPLQPQPQPQQFAEGHKEQQQQQIPSPSPSQQTHQQNSPLYKTRLCERFETEGSCPYGPKCNFAHGVAELRGRTTGDASNQQQHQQDKSDDRIHVDSNGNQLFKTKLCEKFMKDKFCQYGPKCHFAHGEEELKTRPPKREEAAPIADRRSSPPQHRFPRYTNNENAAVDTHYEEMSVADKRSNWRSNANDRTKHSSETPKKAEPLVESATQKMSEMSVDSEPEQATTTKCNGSSPAAFNKKEDQPKPAATVPVSAVSVEELRRPAFVEHQRSSNSSKKTVASTPAVNGNGKEKKHTVSVESNEKAWMKIVKLSKEERDEMEHQSSKSPSISTTTTKLTQKEPIIVELKKFFLTHPPQTTITKGKLTDDVKEVTKVEMRNDLSKKQLLYILLVSLLEEESDQSMLAILKSRAHLFKTLVKTNADQLLLLKAWDSFVTVRKPIMVNKTAIALSHWYDCEMVEEEAFLEWFETLEKGSALEKKSSKFIDWLNESDSEEEEE